MLGLAGYLLDEPRWRCGLLIVFQVVVLDCLLVLLFFIELFCSHLAQADCSRVKLSAWERFSVRLCCIPLVPWCPRRRRWRTSPLDWRFELGVWCWVVLWAKLVIIAGLTWLSRTRRRRVGGGRGRAACYLLFRTCCCWTQANIDHHALVVLHFGLAINLHIFSCTCLGLHQNGLISLDPLSLQLAFHWGINLASIPLWLALFLLLLGLSCWSRHWYAAGFVEVVEHVHHEVDVYVLIIWLDGATR